MYSSFGCWKSPISQKVVNVSLSCQLERAGVGYFAELKLEVMLLLATVNSCKLTENMPSALLL
jgi:hypothetical protein